VELGGIGFLGHDDLGHRELAVGGDAEGLSGEAHVLEENERHYEAEPRPLGIVQYVVEGLRDVGINIGLLHARLHLLELLLEYGDVVDHADAEGVGKHLEEDTDDELGL